MVVIVDGKDNDKKLMTLLEHPVFPDLTEIVHYRLEPIMLSSLLQIQRLLVEHSEKTRMVLVFLVDAWMYDNFSQDDELKTLGNYASDRWICYGRNPIRGSIQAKHYPCDAKGVICVDSELSSAEMVALACLSMSIWQKKDFDSAKSLINQKDVLDTIKEEVYHFFGCC